MLHVTPPSVETYTVDVGLVTKTYNVLPVDEAAVVKNTAVFDVNTEVHDMIYVGLSVGAGVGRPGVYVGDNVGIGVGFPGKYDGATEGIGIA